MVWSATCLQVRCCQYHWLRIHAPEYLIAAPLIAGEGFEGDCCDSRRFCVRLPARQQARSRLLSKQFMLVCQAAQTPNTLRHKMFPGGANMFGMMDQMMNDMMRMNQGFIFDPFFHGPALVGSECTALASMLGRAAPLTTWPYFPGAAAATSSSGKHVC